MILHINNKCVLINGHIIEWLFVKWHEWFIDYLENEITPHKRKYQNCDGMVYNAIMDKMYK